MIYPRKLFWLGLPLSAAVAMASPNESSLAASLDGNWDVVVACSAEPNGGKAFTLRYKAEIRNSVIQGQHGTKDQPGSQSIAGPINPDGTAQLTVNGLVGNPEAAFKQRRENHYYNYQVNARFEGDKGSGSRQKDRACTFTFSRRSK